MSAGKRCFDLCWAIIGLSLLSPIFLLIAIVIKITDFGPVFYRQQRVGRDEKLFGIWKFRTMIVDADQQGRLITVGADSRITRIGKILRKLKFDELPQLINVLVGEMSFVGPRPEVPRYVALYTDEQRQVLKMTPGITDLASIKFRHESDILATAVDPDASYIYDIMPQKLLINLEYAKDISVWNDIKIIFQTFQAICH